MDRWTGSQVYLDGGKAYINGMDIGFVREWCSCQLSVIAYGRTTFLNVKLTLVPRLCALLGTACIQ